MQRLNRFVLLLPVEKIHPNPRQPRRNFDEAALSSLAASVQTHGILQPLTVRRTEGGWELICGERRLRAARMAGLARVPCIETAADDADSAALALMENLQRQDLHYFEEAEAIADYLRRTGATQETAAAAIGRSPSALANKLRLLRLGEETRKILVREELSERHARALLALEDEEERLDAARTIARRKMTVAQAEQYIAAQLKALQSTPPKGRRSVILKDVRLFLNSVERNLQIMRDAGVDAQSGREDTEDAIILTIRIPRRGAEQEKNPLLLDCNHISCRSMIK